MGECFVGRYSNWEWATQLWIWFIVVFCSGFLLSQREVFTMRGRNSTHLWMKGWGLHCVVRGTSVHFIELSISCLRTKNWGTEIWEMTRESTGATEHREFPERSRMWCSVGFLMKEYKYRDPSFLLFWEVNSSYQVHIISYDFVCLLSDYNRWHQLPVWPLRREFLSSKSFLSCSTLLGRNYQW